LTHNQNYSGYGSHKQSKIHPHLPHAADFSGINSELLMKQNNPVGRPKKGNEKRSCYGASLEPATAEQARLIFGSVGKAVEWAVKMAYRQNPSVCSASPHVD
jgi:hypothetical protein